MAYATQQDIIDRYGEDELHLVGDQDNDGVLNQAESDRVDTALEDASAMADAYLRSRYDLPLDSTPVELKRAVVDIAMYELSSNAAVMSEEREKRRDRAVNFLKSISRGDAALDVGSEEPAPTVGGVARFEGPERRFSRENLDY